MWHSITSLWTKWLFWHVSLKSDVGKWQICFKGDFLDLLQGKWTEIINSGSTPFRLKGCLSRGGSWLPFWKMKCISRVNRQWFRLSRLCFWEAASLRTYRTIKWKTILAEGKLIVYPVLGSCIICSVPFRSRLFHKSTYLSWWDNLVIDLAWDTKGKIYAWRADFSARGVDNRSTLLKSQCFPLKLKHHLIIMLIKMKTYFNLIALSYQREIASNSKAHFYSYKFQWAVRNLVLGWKKG